jgi:hypothetical protein
MVTGKLLCQPCLDACQPGLMVMTAYMTPDVRGDCSFPVLASLRGKLLCVGTVNSKIVPVPYTLRYMSVLCIELNVKYLMYIVVRTAHCAVQCF